MSPSSARVSVAIGGRTLTVSSLDKVLYPDTGTTKAEVLAYLTRVAQPLLAQLAGRPVTRVRWPEGTAGESFFEKNIAAGAPEWVPTVTLDSPGSRRTSERVVYPLVNEVATLAWLANLSSLELHVPQWRIDADGRPMTPDRLVIDLDPGAPAGLAECAQVALLARDRLAAVGLDVVVPVTSGSKGLQVYAGPTTHLGQVSTRDVAEAIAEALAAAHPALVTSSMNKALRPGKVFLDWSQNTPAKTTICPYSLRGKRRSPYAAAPRTWAEIEAGADGGPLAQLTPDEVAARYEADGDLMAVLDPS